MDTFGVRVVAYNRLVPDSANMATVKFYTSEQDYLLDQNVYKTLTTGGYFKDVKFTEDSYSDYWFRVEKDTLNNDRFGPNKTSQVGVNGHDNTCDGDGIDNKYHNFLAECILSTTPVRLQLNIKHNGLPVQGATVKLYYSYQDYLNNVNPKDRPTHQVNGFNYVNEFWTTFEGDNTGASLSQDLFTKVTAIDGIAVFEQLEPRQYWIKVSNGTYTNSAGTIKTPNKLSNDPNVTTVLDIGIN